MKTCRWVTYSSPVTMYVLVLQFAIALCFNVQGFCLEGLFNSRFIGRFSSANDWQLTITLMFFKLVQSSTHLAFSYIITPDTGITCPFKNLDDDTILRVLICLGQPYIKRTALGWEACYLFIGYIGTYWSHIRFISHNIIHSIEILDGWIPRIGISSKCTIKIICV